jgi:hypothetical protein
MMAYDNEYIPGNTNNYEYVAEDVHYCTVLSLQQNWLVFVNTQIRILTLSAF